MSEPGGRPMHADEVPVDDATVRRLLSSQFPQWSDLPLERLPDSGTDSAIFRLGHEMGVRLPRIHWAVGQVEKEHRWLPRLASGLPAPVPIPLGRGEPGDGYPHPWLVFTWLGGTSLDHRLGSATADLGRRIGELVRALERLPTDGPPAGHRGSLLAERDAAARAAIRRLRHEVDAGRALSIWADAVDAGPWTGAPVWVHGDLLPGNVLVDIGGTLAGVIDWSQTGVGDPACDGMLAWSLPPGAREAFREALGFDDATWARARGWVIEQTTSYIPYYEPTLPRSVAQARARLASALRG
ncbi:MAG: aminoglycoside phosphotransferase family protein [Acidimicrobiales bacterium]